MSVILQEQFLRALKEDWSDWYEEPWPDAYCEDKYSLVGQDGNAFALMGYTARCMRECGLKNEIKKMQEEAMSGDYNNLICVCNDYVQRCNEIACELDESLKEEFSGLKRLDHVDAFDNGYIMHGDWADISDEDAEELARQASIEDPHKIFFVKYDSIMNPCSDFKWWNGKKYYYTEYDQARADRRAYWTKRQAQDNKLKESLKEIDRKYFTSLNKEEDGHYYILKDGNYVKDFYANSDEDAKKKFQQYLKKDESLKESLWDMLKGYLEEDL